MCLTSTLTVARAINYTLRMYTQAESEMTSVERVLHFADGLPAEVYGGSSGTRGSGSGLPDVSSAHDLRRWLRSSTSSTRRSNSASAVIPANSVMSALSVDINTDTDMGAVARGGARVEFVDVCLRYRPGLPLVLRGVSFVVPAVSRLRIVGRSGRGMSPILHALPRTVEPDANTGGGG